MPPKAKSHIITATPDGSGTRRVPVHRTIQSQISSRHIGTSMASATARSRRVKPETGDCFVDGAAGREVTVAAVEGSVTAVGSIIPGSRCCNGFHEAWIDEGLVVR